MKKKNRSIVLSIAIVIFIFTGVITNLVTNNNINKRIFYNNPITDMPFHKKPRNIDNLKGKQSENLNARSIINTTVYADDLKTGGSAAADKSKVSDYIKAVTDIDGGTKFETMIAVVFASVIGAIMTLVTASSGIKSLDGVVFNAGQYVDGNTPLSATDWSNINSWYVLMTSLTSALLFIAVLFIFIKFIKAAGNVRDREEAIGSIKRLGASAFIILLSPIVIHLLLFINNNFVYAFYSVLSSKSPSLNSTFGVSVILKSMQISSPLAAILILAMFAILQIKINIMFMIRSFNIIVYTIFTPIAAVLWIMDSNINAAKVWLGELLSNIFMQTAYAFLFAVYIGFMGGRDWLTQLIWANLIIALADVLRNMLQGKLTTMSGMNEGNIASSVLGGGLATAGGLGALAGTVNAFRGQSKNSQNPEMSTGDAGSTNTGKSVSSSMPPKAPSSLEKSVGSGSKIGNVAGKVAQGAFMMAAAPMAAVSGNPKAMRSAVEIGKGIQKGVSAVASPVARLGSVIADKTGASNAAQKVTQDFKEKIPTPIKKITKFAKDTAKVASGSSSDDIYKFK